MVHQSNAYFEQCHGADFDPTVTAELRRQCWARWLQHYTYGQPPDRVEYARARVAAIEDGETIEPLPGMRRAAVDDSYRASFLTARPDRPVPAPTAVEQGDGEASSETAGGDQDTTEAPGRNSETTEDGEEPDAARAAVWERSETRRLQNRRVIEAQRELPEPPVTQGACARVCTPRWNVCIARCDDRPASCREACVTEHRTCMRGCF